MSRLTSITLENFKGYSKSQKIPIKPLTLIFGPNSAGKSSIFHALAFLEWCQSKNNCNPDKVEVGWETVSLGGISNLVHGHDLSRVMKIGLGFLREESYTDSEISTEWHFGNLQSSDSDSGVYTAITCKITITGGDGVFEKEDDFGKKEGVSFFANNSTEGVSWRGKMWCSDSEVEALSSSDPYAEDRIVDPSSRLFYRAWNEFLCVKSYWLTRQNSREDISTTAPNVPDIFSDISAGDGIPPFTSELLSKYRIQFTREFITYITEELVRFDGFWPGYQDLLGRENTDRSSDDEWDMALQELQISVVQGVVSQNIRLNFFDTFLRKFSKRDRYHGKGYLTIPEALGADAFAIFQDHIHVGPLRQPPFRDLDETTLLERKEWKPWVALFRDEYLRKDVSDALEALGVKYEIIKGVQETRTSFPGSKVQESKSQPKAVLRFLAKNGDVEPDRKDRPQVASSHLDLGFGVSTVLPLVVALHSECSLLTIEQPELHIHPKLQTELGDLLIKKALGHPQYGKETTVLVETHSEHLILRILRRIRETTEGTLPDGINPVRPEDIAVLYVKPGETGSEVIELPVDANGEFTCDWPGGFFEERIREFF